MAISRKVKTTQTVFPHMKEEHALKSVCVRPQQERVNKVNTNGLSIVSFSKLLIPFYKKLRLDVKNQSRICLKNAVEI